MGERSTLALYVELGHTAQAGVPAYLRLVEPGRRAPHTKCRWVFDAHAKCGAHDAVAGVWWQVRAVWAG